MFQANGHRRRGKEHPDLGEREGYVTFLQKENGDRIALTSDEITLGRDPLNDVVLDDDKLVSRSHVALTLRGGQWVVTDLGSRNGTVVNDRTVVRHPLRNGDVIGIGGYRIIFVSDDDPQATETASESPSGNALAKLTDREREILRLISEGLTDKLIGERLFISANTVRSHLDRIGEKTGLRRRGELTRLAFEMGLVD